MKPFRPKSAARLVAEGSFEQSEPLALKPGSARSFHHRQHGCHLTGSQCRDGFHVPPVFVAERRIGEQILHGAQALAFEHLRAGGAHALHVHQWSLCIQPEPRNQCTMRVMKAFLSIAAVALPAALLSAADLRLGIVGTDTSHVIAFTSVFNNPSHPEHIPGVRIVAAYKGGSPDVESSHTRVDK